MRTCALISGVYFAPIGRSPIIGADTGGRLSLDTNGRLSLDSARLPRLPRSAVGERKFEKEPPTAEEGFEDVGLND